jgi:hypothetical protein
MWVSIKVDTKSPAMQGEFAASSPEKSRKAEAFPYMVSPLCGHLYGQCGGFGFLFVPGTGYLYTPCRVAFRPPFPTKKPGRQAGLSSTYFSVFFFGLCSAP